LITPLLDLGRMDIEVLRQLDQGLLALDRRYSDFRLEGRAVVRWSYISDQFAALLRWIRVSCQAANLIGSVLLA
jgi:hypothetical protein